ncbi:MAG: BlaI/MecI/CopY family transcriptional regulator, partial [Clostridiales Family XIII bacterium]|nr:BlaI/MecI/CopY family transcriptional regulator [Clostridiales Family XIII bacterium]
MNVKLFDSELKVMDVLWQEGDLTAKGIAKILAGRIGWNKNTTYTVIKKCIDKGAI